MQLSFDEFINILDIKTFPSKRTGFTSPPGIYEVSEINKTLAYELPEFVEASITIDDNRLKSNLTINQTITFVKKSFFPTKYYVHSILFRSSERQ